MLAGMACHRMQQMARMKKINLCQLTARKHEDRVPKLLPILALFRC
jgi:hypothetical protein